MKTLEPFKESLLLWNQQAKTPAVSGHECAQVTAHERVRGRFPLHPRLRIFSRFVAGDGVSCLAEVAGSCEHYPLQHSVHQEGDWPPAGLGKIYSC